MQPTRLLDVEPGSLPDRLADRWRTRRPLVAGAIVSAWGYLVMTALLLTLGALLTGYGVDGPVGRWDTAIDRWFFDHRTSGWDGIATWGSAFGDTITVIVLAAAVIVICWWRRHLAHAAFLVSALLIEVTTFLTTTFLIDRERPPVPQLDQAPPTSSFPSGHTAASIVLFVAIALITTSIVRNLGVRIIVWTLAVIVPLVVGLSRLYLAMHHPTDLIGSVIGAAGCLGFALLATRTGVAVSRRRSEAEARLRTQATFTRDPLEVTP